MKEKVLKKLGFKKIKVSTEESGDKPFYYYTYALNNGTDVSFITPANDEIKNKRKWKVEIIETDLWITRGKDLRRIFKIFNLGK
jgi:lysophospholipid acyltransferase (LPLAT)-like uncharacterized protein